MKVLKFLGIHPKNSNNQSEFRMVGAVGTAHSCSNPNTTVWNSKGIWLTYILMILFLHFTLLSIPGNEISKI